MLMQRSGRKVLWVILGLVLSQSGWNISASERSIPNVHAEDLPDVQQIVREALQAIDTSDKQSNAMELAAVAAGLADVGDLARAREINKEALQITAAIQNDSGKDLALWQIGKSQAKAGDIKEALHTAAQIRNGYYHVNTLSFIAEAQAKAKDRTGARNTLKEALKITAKIENPGSEDMGLGYIAAAQAKIGDIKEALHTAAALQDTGQDALNNGDKIREIVEAQVQGKDIKGAIQTAHIIQEASTRGQALAHIAIAQAEAGDQAGAKETIREVVWTAAELSPDFEKALVLRDIAAAQKKVGDETGAREAIRLARQAADNVKGTVDTGSALSSKAHIYAIIGDIEGAVQIATTIQDDFHRTWTFTRIADAQVEAGDIHGALKSAAAIENSSDRIRVLMDIARAVHNRFADTNGNNR